MTPIELPVRPGWVLVGMVLGRVHAGALWHLDIRGASGAVTALDFMVPADGDVGELVELPAASVALSWRLPPDLAAARVEVRVRRVGFVETRLRMAYRVLKIRSRIDALEREHAGLSLRRALFDLPEAFRIASELRAPSFSYAEWIAHFDAPDAAALQRMREQLAALEAPPRFHVIVHAAAAEAAGVAATLAALDAQLYRGFECTLIGGDPGPHSGVRRMAADAIDAGLATLNADLAQGGARLWVLRLRAGDRLSPYAFYRWALQQAACPQARIMYGDDDRIDAAGLRSDPRFKPEASCAHLQAANFVGDAVVLRADALAAAGGLDEADCCRGLYAKILQIVDFFNKNIVHLAAVQLHRGAAGDDSAAQLQWETQAVQRHLGRCGIAAAVEATHPGCRRVRHALPAPPPRVSIIVPTRDALHHLQRCVDSVLTKTVYANYELLVVDNRSRDPAALAYLEDIAQRPAVRVLRYDRPFNFSAINNFAAAQAGGELLCLLNNDTEVITPDWLEEMTGHLLQPQVGAVGAKLLYPDGRVQHGGDTVGPGGCANHLHNGLGGDDPGYCNRAVVAQELSAVTAACLLTRRDLYLALGGLDARRLRVAFNDVDYCLRLRAAGHRVVWTPHARLYHHESVSRGRNDTLRKWLRSEFEVAVMRRRWRQVMANDPFYNPNLNYRRPDFTPGRTRRIGFPWL